MPCPACVLPSPPPLPSYTPSDTEGPYFEALWQVADASQAGALAGKDAVKFFMNSQLQPPLLREVWSIADASQRHFLGRAEFFVALRLIAIAQSGNLTEAAQLKPSLDRTAKTALPLPRFAGLLSPATEVCTCLSCSWLVYDGGVALACGCTLGISFCSV